MRTTITAALVGLVLGVGIAIAAPSGGLSKPNINITAINDTTPTTGNGTTSAGSLRVTVASDNTAFSVNSVQSGSWTVTQSGTASQNVAQFGGNNVVTGTGASGVGIPRVTVSNDSSLAANQSVNVSQIAAATTLTGNGVTGTGSQRVTVASDNTSFSVGTKTNNAAAVDGNNVGALTAQANAAAPTWTEGNLVVESVDLSGRLRTDTSSIAGAAALTGNGVTGTGSQRVTIASDNTSFSVGSKTNNAAAPGATNVGALNALANAAAPTYTEGNLVLASVDLSGRMRTDTSSIAGATALTGNGVTGTGSQRVTIASDNTSFSVGTKSNNAAAPGTTNVGAVTALANAANPTWTEGNLVLASVDLAGRQRQNLSAVGGTAVVNGGLAGTLAVGGTQANNTAITDNPSLQGIEALSTQPTAATTGNIRRTIGSLDGAQYVRLGGPVPWACSLDNIAATLTQCQAVPGAGLKLYLTDITVQSTTATAGQFLVRFGTGANCGTGTTSLLPSAATVVRLAYPLNTASPTSIRFITPLSATANNAICILCVATNTCTVQMSGFTAP